MWRLSRVEPDLACSGALSLTTSGFVWHCPLCWHCEVLMPIRLLSANGHRDDMPRTMPLALAPRHCHIIARSLDCNSSRPLDDIPVLLSHCITVTSRTYLTNFLVKFHVKNVFFFHPGCVIWRPNLVMLMRKSCMFFFLMAHPCVGTWALALFWKQNSPCQ